MQEDGKNTNYQASFWRGRSGQRYSLLEVQDRSSIRSSHIYALAESGIVRWVGTAESLLADPVSREKFRQQDGARTLMLAMPFAGDELAAMTLVWDLEGGQRIGALHAA